MLLQQFQQRRDVLWPTSRRVQLGIMVGSAAGNYVAEAERQCFAKPGFIDASSLILEHGPYVCKASHVT